MKAFVRSAMERYGLTEEDVRKRAIEAYGSVELTMKAMEIGEAENKAAVGRACPNGYAGLQVGRKPKPGEEVTYAQLRDDLMVRVWGGDLEYFEYYCLDFVDHERQSILTPDDVKILYRGNRIQPERPGPVRGGRIGKGRGEVAVLPRNQVRSQLGDVPRL